MPEKKVKQVSGNIAEYRRWLVLYIIWQNSISDKANNIQDFGLSDRDILKTYNWHRDKMPLLPETKLSMIVEIIRKWQKTSIVSSRYHLLKEPKRLQGRKRTLTSERRYFINDKLLGQYQDGSEILDMLVSLLKLYQFVAEKIAANQPKRR